MKMQASEIRPGMTLSTAWGDKRVNTITVVGAQAKMQMGEIGDRFWLTLPSSTEVEIIEATPPRKIRGWAFNMSTDCTLVGPVVGARGSFASSSISSGDPDAYVYRSGSARVVVPMWVASCFALDRTPDTSKLHDALHHLVVEAGARENDTRAKLDGAINRARRWAGVVESVGDESDHDSPSLRNLRSHARASKARADDLVAAIRQRLEDTKRHRRALVKSRNIASIDPGAFK